MIKTTTLRQSATATNLYLWFVTALVLALLACGTKENDGRVAAFTVKSASAATNANVALPGMLARGAAWLPPGAADGDWQMPSRDYAGTRYSPLTELNTTNVAELQVGSSRVDLQACKLEYSIVSPK